MILKRIVKKLLLRYKKSIIVDVNSHINFNVKNESVNSKYPCTIYKSSCSLEIVNEGCNISQTICDGNIILGRFVSILGPGTIIKSVKEKIIIGSFSSIGQNVCIYDFNHSIQRVSSSMINGLVLKENFSQDLSSKTSVIIEEDVWIGSNTVILPGVKIGRGSVIGAGSIVTKDVPRYSIVFGNPAKVHSKRFDDEIIQYLEDLKWWDWSIEKIKINKHLFNANLDKCAIKEIKLQIL